MSFATGDFLVASAVAAAAVVALVLITWLVGKAIGRFNVIDVAWGLGFVVVAWVGFALSSEHGDDTRRVLVAVLVTVWGGRLAGHIAWRSRGKGEDPRYAAMLEGHADPALARARDLPHPGGGGLVRVTPGAGGDVRTE